MREPNLIAVNNALAESLRKSEEDVKKLREAILKAASVFKFIGYHNTADAMHTVWKETAS